jgi:8-oxo-dGTP pyrophosphatase MutT (NUDIX family)
VNTRANVWSRAAIAATLAEFPPERLDLDGHRAAAVAIAIVETSDGPGVLATRRASRMRAHAGQWALPGGRIDAGERPVDAAIRELDEEVGVRVAEAACLGALDDYATRSGYVITPIVLWCGAVDVLRPNPAEVASVHVASFDELDVDPRFVRIPESDAPVVQLPLFGVFIHAPTAAILHQFREVALRGRQTRVAHFEQPVFAWR